MGFKITDALLQSLQDLSDALNTTALNGRAKTVNTLGQTIHTLLALAKSSHNFRDNFIYVILFSLLTIQQPGHLAQSSQPKPQYRIPQAFQRTIGLPYTIESYETIAPLLIPNELPKSLGQIGNKLTTIQSLNNPLNIHNSPGCRVFDVTEKLLDFAGEGIGTTLTTTAPILPRHPQDPIDGLLQVGRAVKREVDRGEWRGI
ncbi:DNA polymerase I [Babesia caballi]|uniref:DNA polymerase I n=1 Tax=Babesia caballi TaxID=5871 RepID=A0AAV4LZ22_BABCB|nr:DNA polymerase I [Babesia caballi]